MLCFLLCFVYFWKHLEAWAKDPSRGMQDEFKKRIALQITNNYKLQKDRKSHLICVNLCSEYNRSFTLSSMLIVILIVAQ